MWVWTVNDAEATEELVRLGVDAIITDDCPTVREIVTRVSAERGPPEGSPTEGSQ